MSTSIIRRDAWSAPCAVGQRPRLRNQPPARALSIVAAAAMIWLGGRPARALPVTFKGDDVVLQGQLFRPTGVGPFPAVVALHGCSGLTIASGALNARHKVWAQTLVQKGFVVLFPDSFAPRGLRPECGPANPGARRSSQRVADAVAARSYVQSLRYVKADAVSLIGWSEGGTAVLDVVAQAVPVETARPNFARAVALYPACRAAGSQPRWRARLPLAILIGSVDDWTPARDCQDLAAAAAGEPVSLTVYPGAAHDFDYPDLPLRTDASRAAGDGRARSGTDPAARADAVARVPAFLAR